MIVALVLFVSLIAAYSFGVLDNVGEWLLSGFAKG